MTVLTFFNHAGGVTKTSLIRDAGHTRASMGLRVLLTDLNPQANLSDWFGLPDASYERTVFDTAVADRPLPKPYDVHGMKLIPSVVDLALAESGCICTCAAAF